MAKVGLIAGIGVLPVEFMRAAHVLGHEVVVIGVVPDIDPALKAEADAFYDIGVAKLGKIFKTLKKEEVQELTMLGKVTKEILFKGLTFPDLKTLGVLKRLKNRKDDTIMLAIVDEIEREGFKVLDQTAYLKPFMPKVGVLSKAQPTDEQWADICFGFELAKQMGALDIGQTVVVKHKAVMAIEAIEEKPNQDVRFDVPAVGIKTLMSMIDSGCKVLAVEAEKTIFVQQQDVLDMADRHGIVICAVDQEFVNSRKDA
ncbi:UDP-2,3-diacylglucosamine diphosphatase LpxI domain-containing protein [Veillonella parvula]|uniref:LpxI family protein n=1 Tax=Veillonella parvula TaxID=29466 RepID=UPI00290299B3|nr:UDP-2,3-diacylglucosamine diphosphatase LpxI [Veillonella parvula]MDU3190874.1 UDP-2,3-diacylglucosamine diphosphatase LpxI [Veillonella parvula]